MNKLYMKLTYPNRKVKQFTTKDKINRFYYLLRHELFKKAYLKVSYGNKECNFGCVCEFYNDGVYENKKEALLAFKMFLEES